MKDSQPEGKRLPRYNYYPVFLRGEQPAYEEHCRMTLDQLAPVGGFEIDIALCIAANQWRLQRARSIDATLSAGGLHTDRTLRFIKEYQRNIQRSCNSYMAELKTAQARRKKARMEAVKAAMNRPTSCIN